MSTTSLSRGAGNSYVSRSSSSGLYDVLDLLLDKGLVIDVFLRVSLVGIELLTVDARIVIASVDTYLRFAEAVNRLDLGNAQGEGLPDLMDDMTEGGASSKTKGVLEGAKEKIFGSDDDDSGRRQQGRRQQLQLRLGPAASARPRHRVPEAARARVRRPPAAARRADRTDRCDGQIHLRCRVLLGRGPLASRGSAARR